MSNDEARISRLLQVLSELSETAGAKENTKIIPNVEVVDASPANLPAGYIIVSDDLGYYVPALKVPGLSYVAGNFVNLLMLKGTEPIAFQHGSGSSGSNGGAPLDAQYYVAVLNDTLTNDIVPGLDTFKVSKLRQLDDGGDALTSDNDGNLTATGNLTVADDKWIGLGSAKGRIEFDDQATDEINILDAKLGIGTSTPSVPLDLVTSNEAIIAAFRGDRAASNINAEYEHVGTADTGNQIILGFVLQTSVQRRTALNIVGSFSDTTDASRTSLAEFRVANNGGIAARLAIAGNNIGVNTTTQFGSGAGVIGIANATTNPTTNPSNGHVLYSDAGALKGRGSSGTVTTIAAAEPHCPVCGRDAILEWKSDAEEWHIQMCAFCLADEIGERPWIRKVVKGNA